MMSHRCFTVKYSSSSAPADTPEDRCHVMFLPATGGSLELFLLAAGVYNRLIGGSQLQVEEKVAAGAGSGSGSDTITLVLFLWLLLCFVFPV